MKKVLVVAAILLMVAGISVTASAAYDPEWIILLQCSSRSDAIQNNTGRCKCRTKIDGLDEYGIGDVIAAPMPPEYPAAYVYAKDESNNLYVTDSRNSFDGRTKTWNLLVGALPGYSFNKAYLYAWNPASMIEESGVADFAPLGGETIKLYKELNDFGGPRELLWTVDPDHNGNGDPADPYTYKGCFDVGTKLQLEVSAVPEPSSILSLLCGIGGLTGIAWRRLSVKSR